MAITLHWNEVKAEYGVSMFIAVVSGGRHLELIQRHDNPCVWKLFEVNESVPSDIQHGPFPFAFMAQDFAESLK